MSKKSTIRLGIIGTGGMANHHATQYKTIKGCELFACFDVNAQRAGEYAAKHGVKHVLDSQDKLIDAVDAVVIVTPDRFHAAPSLAVLKAGKHLFCEKPLTVTLDEARQVAKAAKKASKRGVVHMINFSYRNSSAFQEAIKIAAKGALGEVRHVHSRYLQSWLAGSVWGGWQSEAMLWRLQTKMGSGGVLGDIGCHILDFTTAIAGDLRAVRCTLRTFPKIDLKTGKKFTSYKGAALDANDSALIELDLAGGGMGVCHTTRWATGRGNTVAAEVHGTEGAISINLDDGYEKLNVCLGKNVNKVQWETRTIKPTPSNYQRFITSVRTGENDQPDILPRAQIQAYLDASFRSAESGGYEKIKAWV